MAPETWVVTALIELRLGQTPQRTAGREQAYACKWLCFELGLLDMLRSFIQQMSDSQPPGAFCGPASLPENWLGNTTIHFAFSKQLAPWGTCWRLFLRLKSLVRAGGSIPF